MEFMGIQPKFQEWRNKWSWRDDIFFYTDNDHKEVVLHDMAAYAKFDKKWDGWLVPLVRKVFEVGDDSYDNLVGDVTHQLVDLNTEGLYDACVNFVVEFNARKNGVPRS